MATSKMQRRKPGEHPVSEGTDKLSLNLVLLGVNRISMDDALAIVDLPNSHLYLSRSNRTWKVPCRLNPSSSDKFTLREIGSEASLCSFTISPKKPPAT